MIRFIILLFMLILAVWLGVTIQKDPGYILVAFGHWTIELPLWLGIILTFIIFSLIHWMLRLFHFGGTFSNKLRVWSSRRRLHRSQQRTNRGLIEVAEGNWRRAEKNLIKSIDYNDNPLINYLAAAKAAQEQGAYERRDKYLKQAHDNNPDAKIAIELTQAQLQMHHKQLEQSLATLRHLRELSPHHQYVLKLLKNVYYELNDWQSLIDLLPDLRRYHVFSKEDLTQLELQVYSHLLQKNISKTDNSVEGVWKKIPKNLRNNPDLIRLYSQYLITHDQSENAENLIRHTLKKHWDHALVNLYSLIPNVDSKKQLAHAEHWLKSYSNDPVLLLSLGRLSKANQLWGKARSYFNTSISIKPSKEAYTELGQLLEHLRELPLALDCYRKALKSNHI